MVIGWRPAACRMWQAPVSPFERGPGGARLTLESREKITQGLERQMPTDSRHAGAGLPSGLVAYWLSQ
ncbi:hypothetical protein GCM10009548_72700 [Streptomyces malaysiensis subsp. malaysiensis]